MVRTTHNDKSEPRPLDRVRRQFRGPTSNVLWSRTSPTSLPARASSMSPSALAGCILDPLAQALRDRRALRQGSLVTHRDGGVSSSRSATANVRSRQVSSYLLRHFSRNHQCLSKAGIIQRRGSRCSAETVESATLEWTDWSNDRRLLESMGNIPPRKEERVTIPKPTSTPWRCYPNQRLRQTRRGSRSDISTRRGQTARSET